jgi:hypothetical protein
LKSCTILGYCCNSKLIAPKCCWQRLAMPCARVCQQRREITTDFFSPVVVGMFLSAFSA